MKKKKKMMNKFFKTLSNLADLYVNDAFFAHRAHASINKLLNFCHHLLDYKLET